MATQGHKPRGILPGIQLLRGWAAILVVIFHANGMMGHAPYFGTHPFVLGDVGGFGVAVFFVISGFIIAIVALDPAGAPTMSLRDYAIRRFMRIVPFMWLCVIGYNLLSFAGTREMEWAPFLRAMVVWPVGELKPNVLWSLRHEFLFYLLFALTMLLPVRRPWVLAAWFAAPLVLWLALLPFPLETTPWHPYRLEIVRVVLFGSESGANLQIGAGFLLGLAWLAGKPALRERVPYGLGVATAAVTAGALIIIAEGSPPGLARTVLWTGLSAGIVYLGIVGRAPDGPLRRMGMLLGNASFAIYLVHNPALLVLLEASKRVRGLLPLPAFLVVFVVAATLAGVFVHLLVEKPLISWLAHGRRVAPWMRRRPADRQ
ncbi:acyltransferase family protein [Sphingomonas sp.]|jgi:exopolysaccharide production protein ExoZ|uniref:acyltransferase family protein n=1 Tax=Sphingomonas sp. TaxID=28214 RepID=UPI0035C84BE6